MWVIAIVHNDNNATIRIIDVGFRMSATERQRHARLWKKFCKPRNGVSK